MSGPRATLAAIGGAAAAAGIRGWHRLASAARRLAGRQPEVRPELTREQMELLQALATGSSVAALARQHHRSRSSMNRQLMSLYLRLGVEGRNQAVALAARWGVISVPEGLPDGPAGEGRDR